MRAAVLYGKEDVRVEDVAPRPLQPGEVRIGIEAALTCGTDLKVFKRGYHAKMIVPPAVFGHEIAGVISEVEAPLTPSLSPSDGARVGDRPGEGMTQWRVGDRVVVANSAPCGECFFCRQGQENLCDDLLFLNGAYAESIVVPARLVEKNLLRLKPATSFRDAALTEPLACVVQGVEDSQLRAGQRVLVIGAGPIGLMFVALAKHIGCEVMVAGRGEARLAAARKLGASTVVDVANFPDIETAVAARPLSRPSATLAPSDGERAGVRGRSEKIEFDVVVEAVGKPEIWEAAVRLVRKGGLVNFFGGCPSGTIISLDTTRIHYSNLTLRASFHHTPRSIRRALEFIEAGVIRAEDFVDGECPLSRLPELFKTMAAGNRAVKTLIRVGE
ncbi:MAG: zinc-binding dehydrogenase [Verrucomicrobia bacterium]|nr:zinc-binding dehydrogenase [Verrucomicrobiota bacterium]